MKYGRPWKEEEVWDIGCVEKFEDDFTKWWFTIQPSGRSTDKEGHLRQDISDEIMWDEIRRSGRNGLWAVVVALYWWGSALGEDRDHCRGWWRALVDVSWVLFQLSVVPPAEDSSGDEDQSPAGREPEAMAVSVESRKRKEVESSGSDLVSSNNIGTRSSRSKRCAPSFHISSFVLIICSIAVAKQHPDTRIPLHQSPQLSPPPYRCFHLLFSTTSSFVFVPGPLRYSLNSPFSLCFQ